MAKRINPATQRLKRSVSAQIGAYNRSINKQGLPSSNKANLSVKGLTKKKDILKVQSELKRLKKDPVITTKSGLKIKLSEYNRIKNERDDANKRIAKREEERRAKSSEIAKKWGKSDKPTTKKETTSYQYTRGPDDFKTYKQLQEFEQRVLNAGRTNGLEGDALKEAILKALRGEVYQQANGFKFRGGAGNVLAEFIDENLSGEEVEFFFGGNLNFEYIYSQQEGLIKEFELVHDIIRSKDYPRLKSLWEEKYEDRWLDAMEAELSKLDRDYIQSYGEEMDRLASNLHKDKK